LESKVRLDLTGFVGLFDGRYQQGYTQFALVKLSLLTFVTMYEKVLKPLFFLISAERAHYFAMALLSVAIRVPGVSFLLKRYFNESDSDDAVEVCGLKFPNAVGLAAGFDKDARWLNELSVLGFGHVEIGTLTPKPQPGNPQPRLFRLPQDSALLNRMGFNNGGVEAAVERLKRRPEGLIVGGNIGRNKSTPNDKAVDDYLTCFDALHQYVDYFTVNVSSPNTPGLRELQDKEPLAALLRAVVKLNRSKAIQRPVFLKIAPDMTDSQLDDVIDIIISENVDGIIATNTTISREDLVTPTQNVTDLGAGGVSGEPVRLRSTEVVRYLHEKSNGAFLIIGVGGIDGVTAAREKLNAGAVLVQIYSGMIFKGPDLASKIIKGLK
jgi:dihydroorotate dehydrogenase